MKKVFTVPEVEGSKVTSSRDLTHALIGRFSYDNIWRLLRWSASESNAGKNLGQFARNLEFKVVKVIELK